MAISLKDARRYARKMGLGDVELVRWSNGLCTCYAEVSPVIAQTMLQCNVKNRPPKFAKVHMFARDMTAGTWQDTHQGIAFGDDVNSPLVADAQNRLLAILSSGVTVQMMITFGLTKEAILAVDTGTSRNVGDTSAFLEGARPKSHYTWVKQMRSGNKGSAKSALSNQEAISLAEEFCEAIDWLARQPKKNRITTNSQVMGAFGRAYLWLQDNHEGVKLEEYIEMLGLTMETLIDGQWQSRTMYGKNTFRMVDRFRGWLIETDHHGQFPKIYELCEYVISETLANTERQKWPGQLKDYPDKFPQRELFEMYWEKEDYKDGESDNISVEVRKAIKAHVAWKKSLSA